MLVCRDSHILSNPKQVSHAFAFEPSARCFMLPRCDSKCVFNQHMLLARLRLNRALSFQSASNLFHSFAFEPGSALGFMVVCCDSRGGIKQKTWFSC